MGLSVETVRARWQERGPSDPLFEPIDGSNCPDLPRDEEASHSLLLNHGLFRIFRPWPPRDEQGNSIEPEFSLQVLRDPTGCNRDPKVVSVYRRPRPAANLKYVTAIGFPFDPKNGLPLKPDPKTGEAASNNLLADARALTLEAQAIDALVDHMQLHGVPDPGALSEIVAFERQLYSAQSAHTLAGNLNEGGARGGPRILAQAPAGALQRASSPIWSEFYPWLAEQQPDPGVGGPRARPQQTMTQAMRQSVARGAALFSQRTFLVVDSAGLTDTGFGNPVRNGCAFCHNMQHAGLDVAPGQVDIGTVNRPFAELSESNVDAELPLFRLTCKPGAMPHPHLGPVVDTHDPGFALTTGRCIDIGKITAQSLRGLAARAPYFASGAARTLGEVVDYYDKRYKIELSEQDKADLTHLLEAL